MVLLLLSILSSTTILVIFKLSEKLQVKSLPIIALNYAVATLLGFFLADKSQISLQSAGYEWIAFALGLGVLFIGLFFIVAQSTQLAGIAPTTIATKMSVIFPILLSLAIEPNDKLTPIKLSGFILAITALLLSSYPSKKEKSNRKLWFPIILFFGMGLIDSLMKFSQAKFVSDELKPIFLTLLFGTACIIGFVLVLRSRENRRGFLEIKTLGLGLALGAANFGSAYFFIGMLNYSTKYGFLDSSTLIGVNNIGIVLCSSAIGRFIFKEKYSMLNIGGIVLAVFALYLLTYLVP
ncbi:MAG TPA: hypothetical protein VMW01_05920 [Williamwhitmania sp.]|nr:hypothetical protein [Williamwhitmania sp.]